MSKPLRFTRILIVMSKSFLHGILLTCLFTSILLANDGNAQHKSMKEVIVSIDLEDATLRQMINALEAQTEFKFIYSGDFLTKTEAYKITLSADNKSVAHVLQQVASATGLLFQQNDGAIAVGTDDLKEEEPPITLPEPVLEQDISGKVTDENGEPLPGASVLVKGTSIGVITDADGNYRISAPDEATTLVFSFVGYERQEVEISGRAVIDVGLILNVTTLGEIVVSTGYWETDKRASTGNIAKITSDIIEKQPVGNPLATLQGQVAGLEVTQQTGVPGGGFNVRIRGQNSLRDQGNDPLYIIDGVPFFSNSLTRPDESIVSSTILVNGINPLNSINPLDIESIEVLKDADATAIYGSRGANGVILITTKKGTKGKTQVDANIQTGVGKMTRRVDLLNAQQYEEMRMEAFDNDGETPNDSNAPDLVLWDQSRETDWQDQLLGGTASIVNSHASISGGTASTQYLLGGGYRKETTVFPGENKDERASVNFNLNSISENKKLKTNLSMNYSVNSTNLLDNDLTSLALGLPPIAPALYDDEGNLNWENSTWINPLSFLKTSYQANTNNLVSNMVLSYEIFSGLQVKSSFGYTNNTTNTILQTPLSSLDPATVGSAENQSTFTKGSFETWIVEPQINWTRKLGTSFLDVLVGTTFQNQDTESLIQSASGFASEALMEDINAADDIEVIANSLAKYRYTAVYGRVNLNIKEKYIINLTGRRDGSSRFGPGKQFGNFGAIGVAWTFSNEDFIKTKTSFLSFGKLRGSYGTSGNDQIGNYQFLSTYRASARYFNESGLTPTRLFNPDFAWETNKKIEAALELGFLEDRIFTELAHYRNRSSDQLVGVPLPPNTGFLGITANLPATVQNQGWEFVLRTINISLPDFSWSTTTNLTIPRSELIEYPNLEGSSFAERFVIGEPLNIVKSYNHLGVDPETGELNFEDINEDGVISIPDRQTVIDISQNFFGGVQNSIRYKGLELNILFQFVRQKNFNNISIFGTSPGVLGNLPVEFLDRWRNPGDVASIQRFSQNGGLANNGNLARQSTLAISDASFIRLKNISLSYRLPSQWTEIAGIRSSRIFVQGQNLLTITEFKGLDPESTGSALPPLAMLVAGLNLSF